jgi:hypothetical protein
MRLSREMSSFQTYSNAANMMRLLSHAQYSKCAVETVRYSSAASLIVDASVPGFASRSSNIASTYGFLVIIVS